MSMIRRVIFGCAFSIVSGLSALAGDVDKPGTVKQWGPFEVTLLTARSGSEAVRIEFLLQNKGKEERGFSYSDSVRVLSDEGDMGIIQFSSLCAAALPHMGKLKCKLDVAFDATPSSVTVQVFEDGLNAAVAGRKKWPMIWFTTPIAAE